MEQKSLPLTGGLAQREKQRKTLLNKRYRIGISLIVKVSM